jgi:5-methyltetrahydrofolate--homocysteine methyltransferase
MKDFIRSCLAENRFIFFDGGTGTYLQENGLKTGVLPETFNVDHPEVLKSLHRQYLEAGANIILANTFGANRLKFPADSEYPVEKLVRLGVQNAVEERDAYLREHPERHAFVALDLGPTGKLLAPMGDLEFEDAVSVYAEVVRIGAESGADVIAIETMSDSYELKAAVLAAKENCDLPVLATVIFGENGKLLTGADPAGVTALLEGLRVDALGINCGFGPDQMEPIIRKLSEEASIPLIINPNAGLPKSTPEGKTYYDIGPEEFVRQMEVILKDCPGVTYIGGCCGTMPAHIAALKKAFGEKKTIPLTKKNNTVVCSGMRSVKLGIKPLIVGERINPTGKPKLKAALREERMEYVLNEGVSEEEHGAHILDVNVGLPEIDEPAMLKKTVVALQGVTPLPLQIDTTDITAMEGALRIYNGKPMVNSVNGKIENMEAVFPLVKKYGGTVVCLLLDEDGIPATSEGRLTIAKRIIEKAAEYGIEKKDLVLDGLVMAVSTDKDAAATTLETVRRIRDELHMCSTLGVSNVSFGLPRRDLINTTFYAAALENGLSAGIINPNADNMKAVYDTYLALHGFDEQCMGFIENYGETVALPVAASKEVVEAMKTGVTATQGGGAAGAASSAAGSASSKDGISPLQNSIVKGMKDKAAAFTKEALERGEDSLKLINEQLVPALDIVGKGFEKGTLFLPQLLMSAEAAKACFAMIRDKMPPGSSEKKKAKYIIATVKGDIHDIGKNIVKVLLENYSYDVIDLGKDVPPEVVVETAIRENVRMIGLSALMTTTVASMADTIKALREAGVDAYVMVGGAVLNQEYADMIGADAYCADAMETVRTADAYLAEHPEIGL